MALTDNLTSYWKLDEASGSRADSHGTNTLTDNNTVTQAAGKIGNAAQFTPANLEYLSHADNADLSTGDIDFTIAAWVYLDSKAGEIIKGIVAKDDDATHREYQLLFNGTPDRFQFQAFNGVSTLIGSAVATAMGPPSLATWYYIMAWHDSVANTVNITVNNGAVESAATTGVPGHDVIPSCE